MHITPHVEHTETSEEVQQIVFGTRRCNMQAETFAFLLNNNFLMRYSSWHRWSAVADGIGWKLCCRMFKWRIWGQAMGDVWRCADLEPGCLRLPGLQTWWQLKDLDGFTSTFSVQLEWFVKDITALRDLLHLNWSGALGPSGIASMDERQLGQPKSRSMLTCHGLDCFWWYWWPPILLSDIVYFQLWIVRRQSFAKNFEKIKPIRTGFQKQPFSIHTHMHMCIRAWSEAALKPTHRRKGWPGGGSRGSTELQPVGSKISVNINKDNKGVFLIKQLHSKSGPAR